MSHIVSFTKDRFLFVVLSITVMLFPVPIWGQVPSGDRAVNLSRQARDNVNRSGKQLVSSTKAFFQAFAENTSSLQNILDTKKALKNSGMLDGNEAIEPNLNARFMIAVGDLKQDCDKHVFELKRSLELFEESIAKAITDTQDVKAINSNYELALKEFKKREQKKYDKIEKQAMDVLEACNQKDKHACSKYRNLKNMLRSIEHQVTLYKSKVKIAQMNQQLGAAMRDKIKTHGPAISSKMRIALTKLYGVYHRLADIIEMGGPDLGRSLTRIFGGLSTGELMQNLDITTQAIDKLSDSIDEMVSSILGDIDQVQSPVAGVSGLAGSQINIEEEMKSLSLLRQKTFGE